MLNPIFANRLNQTLTDIKNHPLHLNQSDWHCGTNHCFAGFAEVRAESEINNLILSEALKIPSKYNGKKLNSDLINNKYFGLTEPGWRTLINATNTLNQLAFIVENLIENNGSIKIKYANYAPIKDFSYMNLNHADLSYSNFEYANFYQASLYEANLSYSNLSYANFKYTNLIDADLTESNLCMTNMDNARLE